MPYGDEILIGLRISPNPPDEPKSNLILLALTVSVSLSLGTARSRQVPPENSRLTLSTPVFFQGCVFQLL